MELATGTLSNVTSSLMTAMTTTDVIQAQMTTSMEDVSHDKNESLKYSRFSPTRTPYANASIIATPSSTPDSSTVHRLFFDGKDTLVWQLANNGAMGAAFMVLGLAAIGTLVIVLALVACMRKKTRYQKLPTSETPVFDYIYRPLQGGRLDEEYENTFVGVSIPLLQDNTKV